LIVSSQAARVVREDRRRPARPSADEAALPPAGRVERLAAELPAPEAFAVIEHLYGAAPLVAELLPAGELSAAVAAGETVGALGLFTPTPAAGGDGSLGWGGAPLAGEALAGGGLRLSGALRLATALADGALALARVREDGDEARHHLVWLEIDDLERDGDAPVRVELEGAEVPAGAVSEPLDLSPGGALARRVARYAELWGLAAALAARGGVRALRRAARLAGFQAHQLVAMPLTEAEIEAEAALAAVRLRLAEEPDEASGGPPTLSWATALAAARALAAAAGTARALRDRFGLEADESVLADPSAATALAAWLGGPGFLEHELSRSITRGLDREGAP
jgi:hypothetical protein